MITLYLLSVVIFMVGVAAAAALLWFLFSFYFTATGDCSACLHAVASNILCNERARDTSV